MMIFCTSIAGPLPNIVQAYTQQYSFGGRIKLIICQIRYELSVHEISTSWKKTLDDEPYSYSGRSSGLPEQYHSQLSHKTSAHCIITYNKVLNSRAFLTHITCAWFIALHFNETKICWHGSYIKTLCSFKRGLTVRHNETKERSNCWEHRRIHKFRLSLTLSATKVLFTAVRILWCCTAQNTTARLPIS